VTRLEAALRRIAVDLTDAGVRFALVGGVAVSARTEPRFTRDLDFAVAVANDAGAEALVRGLVARGYRIEAIVEQDALGRLATARLTRAAEPGAPVVDLLFASSGIEAELVADADAIELLPGFRIPVAKTGHLIALKVLSRDDRQRPQDVADLRALLLVASPTELERATGAVALITARGYHRGRVLRAELDELTRPD
jgi:predicted nucleotidyltransferase